MSLGPEIHSENQYLFKNKTPLQNNEKAFARQEQNFFLPFDYESQISIFSPFWILHILKEIPDTK